MNIITDPLFYIAAVPVVLLYGMAKGGLGPAVGAISIPIMSLVINPVQAAAIMLPILCVMDLFATWNFRRSYDLHHLKILVPSGIIGIVLASLLIGYFSQDVIRIAIGLSVIWFCLDFWLRSERAVQKMGGKLSGCIWGTVAGFTSTQIHAGGAPASIYLLPQKLDKHVLMGTMAIFFTVMNYLKLIPYSMMGLLSLENIATSLVLIPLAPIGVKIGRSILEKIRQEVIYRFLYVALFLSGIKLIFNGIS